MSVNGSGLPIPMGPRVDIAHCMVLRDIAKVALVGAIIGFTLFPEELARS